MPTSDRKTIDDINRLKSFLNGDERFVGRDGIGDFRSTLLSIAQYVAGIVTAAGYTTKEIDDEDYTILDTENYSTYIFKNLTADRVLNFPTLADNQNKKFTVINASGDYDVECTPEGSELINDWNYKFSITEKGGEVEFKGLSNHWAATPLNDACIYYVESETVDSGLSVDGTWDDVEGMELLDGIYGQFLIEAFGVQYARRDGGVASIYTRFGIGSISGDNAPNIAHNYQSGNGNTTSTVLLNLIERHVNNAKYISDGSTIYMKACTHSTYSNHRMYGNTGSPMYIKAKRIY